jgi:hypothetical protein
MGFDEDHVSILSSPLVLRQVAALLGEPRERQPQWATRVGAVRWKTPVARGYAARSNR